MFDCYWGLAPSCYTFEFYLIHSYSLKKKKKSASKTDFSKPSINTFVKQKQIFQKIKQKNKK
jgi:imidazoleglycerol phosphate synthase glutamine amidotransferase subunit HisH